MSREGRKWKTGQVVRLKSGSPDMTVVEPCTHSHDKTQVTYFDEKGIHTDEVHDVALELVPTKGKGTSSAAKSEHLPRPQPAKRMPFTRKVKKKK